MSEQMANTYQNGQQSLLQPITATKRRRSNKPPAIKAAVVAKRVQGEAISQIAEDLEISRPTVYAIIDEANIDKVLEDGRIGAAKLVPKGLTAIESTLDKGDGYLGIKLLTGLGILGTEQKAKAPSAAPNLHLQIMNLVGQANTENKAVTPSSSTIAVPQNSADDAVASARKW